MGAQETNLKAWIFPNEILHMTILLVFSQFWDKY